MIQSANVNQSLYQITVSLSIILYEFFGNASLQNLYNAPNKEKVAVFELVFSLVICESTKLEKILSFSDLRPVLSRLEDLCSILHSRIVTINPLIECSIFQFRLDLIVKLEFLFFNILEMSTHNFEALKCL